MKKILLYTLLFPLFTAFTSCGEDVEMNRSSYVDGTGGLSLKNNTPTQITIPVIPKSADFTDIEADNFYVGILDENGAVVKEFDTFTDMKAVGLPLILPCGDYSAIASSYKLGETKVSDKPYFVEQQEFVIEEKTTTNVALKCTFQSIGVELALSEQFKKKLEEQPNNYDYEVKVSNGVADWTFSKEKTDVGYFIDACDELVVKVKVRLGDDKWYPERTYRVKNDDNNPATSPKLGEYYIINLDAGETPEKLSLRTVTLIDQE